MNENKIYRKLFDICDKEGKNNIEGKDLKNILESLGHDNKFEELDAPIMDKDLINFNEFSIFMDKLSNEVETELSGEFIFKRYAVEGRINSIGLKEILVNHTESMTIDQIDRLVDSTTQIEPFLTYEQFKNLNIFTN